MTDHIRPVDWIADPLWKAPVRVIARGACSDHNLVAVNAPHLERSPACVLSPDDWGQIRRVARADYRDVGFTGDPMRFRLAIDAHRLRLAHSIAPYAALNASRIDPLSHQFEAVYERLLARPVRLVRCSRPPPLPADDGHAARGKFPPGAIQRTTKRAQLSRVRS